MLVVRFCRPMSAALRAEINPAILRTTSRASARTTQEKGPAVSDGPLLAININRGTNELSFADQVGEVNISLDRLAFVQTYCTIFRVGRLR